MSFFKQQELEDEQDYNEDFPKSSV